MFRRSVASVWRDDEGSVLIEATVLTPFLFTLMLGLFEFSWYFHKQQLVESGVRDAARYLARVAPEGTDPCTLTTPVDFEARAQNIAVTGLATGGTPRVPEWTTGSVTLSCATFNNSGAAYEGGPTIYLVTASTSFADPDLGFFGFLGLTTPNLSASHTERSIGPG
jgi:Flp pilus assembly protein TadG